MLLLMLEGRLKIGRDIVIRVAFITRYSSKISGEKRNDDVDGLSEKLR
jgi:hypothetical protein